MYQKRCVSCAFLYLLSDFWRSSAFRRKQTPKPSIRLNNLDCRNPKIPIRPPTRTLQNRDQPPARQPNRKKRLSSERRTSKPESTFINVSAKTRQQTGRNCRK